MKYDEVPLIEMHVMSLVIVCPSIMNGADAEPFPGHPWLTKSSSEVMTIDEPEEMQYNRSDCGNSFVVPTLKLMQLNNKLTVMKNTNNILRNLCIIPTD